MSPFLWATSSFQKNNIAIPKIANFQKIIQYGHPGPGSEQRTFSGRNLF